MTSQLFDDDGVYGADIRARIEACRAACGKHADNARMTQEPSVKTLVLTHLLPQIDQPGIGERIVHEIQQVFAGRVIWGEDFDVAGGGLGACQSEI